MKYLRIKQVIQKIGFSRSFIYAQMSKNAFPKNFKIGSRAVVWLEEEIDKWMISQCQF